MKKMYKYILIITLMMFGFVGEVRASSINKICSYTISNNDELESIDIYYNTVKGQFELEINSKNRKKLTKDKIGDYFISSNVEKMLGKADCPKNIYYKDKYLCLDTDSDSNYCLSNTFESAKIKADKSFSNNDKIDDSNYKIEKTFKTNIIDKTGLNISPKAPFDSCVDFSLSGDIKETDYNYCEALCYYSDKELKNFAFIYFVKNASTNFENFKVSFSWSDKTGGQGKMRALYSENGAMTYAELSSEAKEELINGKNGVKKCPLKVYRNDYKAEEGRICFENNEHHCTDENVNILLNEQNDGFGVEENKEKIENLEEELQNNAIETKECKSAEELITSKLKVEEVDEICGFANINSRFYIALSNNKYSIFEGKRKVNGELELNEITNIQETSNFSYNSTATCKAYPSVYHTEGVFTPDKTWNKWDTEYEYYCSVSKNTTTDPDNPVINNDNDCKSLLGVSLVEEINSYLLYIKIAVPILIIVLGSIDFVKAFIASDEDKMKKAQKHFIMRLIIGMVIFFIPAILNALLNIANQVWGIFGNTCGITF